jgi:hypothetical protein
MADDSGEREEFEPLEVVPVPVFIQAHDPDVAGSSAIRVFFRSGAYGDWPGGRVSDVVVLESEDRVSIGLVRREVFGEAPDETMYGESLKMGGRVSLDVPLSSPLGTRLLIDASTGAVIPRVERRSSDPLPGEAAGTPLWRWS